MKKTFLARVAILLLIASTLSGCIWAVEDDGYGRDRGHHGEHRGEHHGEHHDGDHR